MTNLLAVPLIAFTSVYTCISNWLYGLWFLLCHPVQFNMFIGEWRKHQAEIANADDAAAAGYGQLNRRQRRGLRKGIR